MAVFYADEYRPDFGVPYPRFVHDREKLFELFPEDDQLRDFYKTKTEMEAAGKVDPMSFGYRLESWDAVMESLPQYRNHVILGGNRCLAPEVPLWVEERKEWVPISKIGSEFTTWAWDGEKQVLAKASAPFIKGYEPMVTIGTYEPGSAVRCTKKHRVLSADGDWVSIGGIGPGVMLKGTGTPHEAVFVEFITESGSDFVWDITVPGYENYVTGGLIHHNSSKSSFAASLVVDAAMRIPEAKIRCWHVNEERSIMEQQSMVWAALPERYKLLARKKGPNHNISYSQKNGFSSGKLILPPAPGAQKGSEILFANYQQYRNDAQVAEGWWAHLIWGDEEMPQQLFDTLQYRLIDARGRMILTFTTLQGWSPLVSDIMARTKTLERRHAPLLGRDIQYKQESLSRDSTRIYYFWTQDNPFVPADDFLATLKGRPDEEVLARAYGIPSRSSSSPFPCFDETVHVLPADKMPWKLTRKDAKGNILPPPLVTRYQVIDPSGSKPWFIIWAAVDQRGAVYVYREFPDEGFGEWARPGKDAFGLPGPAQKALGWGFEDYRDMMLRVESETGEPEEIFERLIDPRLGAAQVQSKEGATSIITELEDVGISTVAAPGLNVDHGISLINDRLSYDTTQPLSALNAPKLYISEACPNLIYAFKNFTNMGGKDEATKDGIDCARYLLEAGADYVTKEKPGVGPGTFSY